MRGPRIDRSFRALLCVTVVATFALWTDAGAQKTKTRGHLFNDSHSHLTNYIQEGITPQQFLTIMGDKVGRSTLFGIPLQQQWSYRVSGDERPTYYLDSDA